MLKTATKLKPLLWLSAATQLLTACNPIFVSRAIYEESKILLRREDIAQVLQDPKTTATERQKLELVLAARNYAAEIGLDPKESFTQYSRLDRDVLAWVVVGSKPDAFELFTWWFPIVGSVPYKGYFEREGADHAAKKLESLGYETWVRPTEAISTLGWFNDPVLSTTLANQPTQISNTVLHESTHSTVWIPGSVDFNESLANYVGHTANLSFYERMVRECSGNICAEDAAKWQKQAMAERQSALAISNLINSLYQELDLLYKSSQTKEHKLLQRDQIFEKFIAPLRAKNPGMRAFKRLNNAEIMQLKLYMTGLADFDLLFQYSNQNWNLFFNAIRSIKECLDKEEDRSPWELLKSAAAADQHELCRPIKS